ncbi:MAG: hypothetical protein C4576_18505 [Desulfobacteraceae bacterium]|nr:MAG: hypothetical protein C4576_18505 [Desulfobacteraceae bacterium]
MELWVGALNLGFLYAFMTIGIFITFRVFDFPDITVDGSFTTGAAATAVLITSGIHPIPAVAAGFFLAAAAGLITALIHTRLNVNGLLAGILVMTGLYSVNLHVMGRSNIPLLNQTTFFTHLESLNPGLHSEIWTGLCLAIVMTVFWILVSLFFKTDLGITMRVTGNNPTMAGANGVNVNLMKMLGIALANGLVGVSGALVAQYQGFADIGMGIGTVVIGLASVIIGEALLKRRSIYLKILSVFIGSVIFRFMIAFALFVGMNPIDMKLLTALFVLLTLMASKSVSVKKNIQVLFAPLGRKSRGGKRVVAGAGAALVILLAGFVGIRLAGQGAVDTSKMPRIGLVQLADNGLLNITRDSFVEEMKRIGYEDGRNCRILLENANGDLAAVSSILDKFTMENVDIIVPVSTACTQTAVNRIKDRPIVFATVANPFIIGAGKSEIDHLPNVTGVYGWVPMNEVLAMVKKIMPGKIKVGSIWDQAQSNSVFNVENLRRAAEADGEVTFAGNNITNSSEVYQAALGLVNKGIDAFVLSPDNIVYSAFESVVKAAKPKKIPIAVSDVERLADGALLAYGYDYTISGIQAANLVDRILKGEDPAKIPFERYKRVTIGINMRVAEELGFEIPDDVMAKATCMIDKDGSRVTRESKKGDEIPQPAASLSGKEERRLALFTFGDDIVTMQIVDGVMEEFRESGILEKYRVRVDRMSAHNEFSLAQSIVQEIVRRRYDYIITLTTPALQAVATVNKKIPHVFGAVTDPYRTGIGRSAEDHLPNVTGLATLEPVEATVKAMRELFPRAKRIGMVWNPGEACSEACTYKAREAAQQQGFELVESTVTGTGEVLDAVKALISKGIDIFYTSGDNTVIAALESVAEVLKNSRIPYLTNIPAHVEQGAFLSIGADYYEVGRETARHTRLVIEGRDPKGIPIKEFVPETMAINLKLAEQYGIQVNEGFLSRAERVIR